MNPHRLTYPVLYGTCDKAAAERVADKAGPAYEVRPYAYDWNRPLEWGVRRRGHGFSLVNWKREELT